MTRLSSDEMRSTELSYWRLIEGLAVEHRARAAMRQLLFARSLATRAVRLGLRHPDPAVRIACCNILDHHLDRAALPELIATLEDENDRVRARAMHALACDRCKEGECRPNEDEVVTITLDRLRTDASRRVRQEAAQLLGWLAFRRPEVCQALEWTRDHDPDPLVRKIACWYTPSGTIYRRVAPSGKPGTLGGKPVRRPRPGSLLPRS